MKDVLKVLGKDKAASAALVLDRALLILHELSQKAPARSHSARYAGKAYRALASLLDPQITDEGQPHPQRRPDGRPSGQLGQ